MLTQTAKITDFPLETVASRGATDVTAEIISLHWVDEGLPDRIRANFRSVQETETKLLTHLEDRWDDKTEALFKSFNTAVLNHLKFISVHMYVPLKQRLRHDSSGGFAKFQEFEIKASKSYVAMTASLRKYYRKNQFFNTEFVTDMKADVKGVVWEMSQQLNRERAYLFPRYLSDR